ncbi:hypothetical protein [Halobacteriovorax sp.]|uniref:hypothetical protein n=1 Tax=Halobacteriovorax sp. TaxID=2020862 RepID=UPI003AF2557E
MEKYEIGTYASSSVDIRECQECLGKEFSEVNSCRICDGAGNLRLINTSFIEFNDDFKNTSNTIYQEGPPTTKKDLIKELNQINCKYNTKDIPRESESSQESITEIDNKSLSFSNKIVNFVLFVIGLIILSTLLFYGLEQSRKNQKPETPKVQKEKKEISKTEENAKADDKRISNGFDLSNNKLLEAYRTLSYDDIRKNKSLMKFMKANLVKGQRHKNEMLMSTKGVFHICSSFEKHKIECRDKWFRSKEVRDQFVERINKIIKKKEGYDYLE